MFRCFPVRVCIFLFHCAGVETKQPHKIKRHTSMRHKVIWILLRRIVVISIVPVIIIIIILIVVLLIAVLFLLASAIYTPHRRSESTTAARSTSTNGSCGWYRRDPSRGLRRAINVYRPLLLLLLGPSMLGAVRHWHRVLLRLDNSIAVF